MSSSTVQADATHWAPAVAKLEHRTPDEVRGVVVHRIEVSQEDASYGDTPAEVVRFFDQHPIGRRATGGAMAYPLLIEASGALTQCLPLASISPHAKRYNPSTIGVACVGDFRRKAPTEAQRQRLVELCAALLAAFELSVDVLWGHDELSGASSDPDKECPGRLLDMTALRRDVAQRLRDDAPAHALRWSLPGGEDG